MICTPITSCLFMSPHNISEATHLIVIVRLLGNQGLQEVIKPS